MVSDEATVAKETEERYLPGYWVMLCNVRVMDVTGGLTRPETTCGGGHCHLSLSLLLG
jgi:hypothetical protein